MELYVVCLLMAIALALVIIKGIQLVISIMYPWPSEAEIKWRQYPQLPLGEQQKQKFPGKSVKQKPKEPKGKRPPRSVRLEQIYSSSPLSFDELDSSFSRSIRSPAAAHHSQSSRSRPPLRYSEDMLNTSGYTGRESAPHEIHLEQLSFVEDEEDPIEVYVQQQHQKLLLAQQNRSSTPIQSYSSQRVSSKSHATIV